MFKQIFVGRILILNLALILGVNSNAYSQVTKIMLLGDSITQGINGSTTVGGFRDDLDGLLTSNSISFDFVGGLQDGAGFDVDHEGHPGWKADQIDANVNSFLAAANPDMVLIHIGTNDISSNETNATTISDITGIVDKIHSFNPLIKIIVSALIPRNDGDGGVKDGINTALNTLISGMVSDKKAQGYLIFLANHNEVFIADPTWQTDYMSDTIHPNDAGYAKMAEVYLQAIQVALNQSNTTVIDDFNRTFLGSAWNAVSTFEIINNELANNSTANSWDLAVYTANGNPQDVAFTWGASATANGISNGGMALMLDAPTTNANGYLVFREPTGISLWTIVNGAPSQPIVEQQAGLQPFPQAGDTYRVAMRTDTTGHHFDTFINGVLDGTVTDPSKLQGNSSPLFSGVLIRNNGTVNNSIDNYTITVQSDTQSPDPVSDLAVGSVSPSSVPLTWTATGDDGSTGQAALYDLRYSTSLITAANFDQAVQVQNVIQPSPAGTSESFTVGGLNQSTLYYFAIKVTDEASNTSSISNVVSTTTGVNATVVDNFNRADLGTNWNADPEYQIISGELANTATVHNWGFMATYIGQTNPDEVSFRWGQGADTTGIAEGGFALMLDSASPNANGYLLFREPTGVSLWTIVNGAPAAAIVERVAGVAPAPQAGSVFKVIMRTDANGHHFDTFIDGQFNVTVTDPAKLQGNVSPLYSGIMLRGNLSNNIDDYTLSAPPTAATNLTMVSGDNQSASVGQQLPLPLDVRVTDSNNFPVSGVPVDFQVVSGGGTITSAGTVIRVNAGGASFADNTGRIWQADQPYSPGSFGYIGSTSFANSTTDPIANTTDDPLYQNERAKIGSYKFDLPNGSYIINLHFAEIFHTAPNSRVFNVSIEGTAVLSNLDIFAEAGHDAALVKSFNVTVNDGSLDIDFSPIKDNTTIMAIEVVEASAAFVTDSNGEVTAIWTLGGTLGTQTAQASATGLTGSPVTFTATGLAGPPQTITKISGDNQTAPAGTQLPIPLVVELKDAGGNFNGPNYPVLFQVTSGNGTLAFPDTVLTDAQGRASNTLTTSTDVPVTTVHVTAPGYAGPDIIFTENAEAGPAATIALDSGNNQTGTAGKPLSSPFAVLVTDAIGIPVSGVDVNFSVTGGGGDFNNNTQITVQTDTSGIAGTTLTLGPSPAATNTAQASATGLTGSPIMFTAISADPESLVAVSQLNLSGTASVPLPDSIKVRVRDALGENLANYPVDFNVTLGGGTINGSTTPIQISTDNNGIAKVEWRLGDNAGSNNNKLVASSTFLNNNLMGSPIEFTASAAVGNAANLVEISGNDQSGLVGMSLSEPFVVKVTDLTGTNTVVGWPVKFKVTAGGGNFNGQDSIVVSTNAQGLASATLTVGGVAGTPENLFNNVVEISSENNGAPLSGSPITFRARSLPTELVEISGNDQSGLVETALAEPFVVKVTYGNGTNVVVDWPVKFRITAGGGNFGGQDSVIINTNAQGLASATLTLGSQAGTSQNPFNNIVEISSYNGEPLNGMSVTFRAKGLATDARDLILVQGDSLEGQAGLPLPQPIIVKVTDGANNNPIENHPVTFMVNAGGGTIDGTTEVEVQKFTDQTGVASVNWYLGGDIQNTQSMVINSTDGINNLNGSPLTIHASASPGPVDPDSSEVISDRSSLPADGTTEAAITIKLTDKFGNPVQGKAVLITSTGSNNDIAQPLNTTNANGEAFGSISSTSAEVKTISARNVTDGFDLNSFVNLTFKSQPADRMQLNGGNNQFANVGTAVPTPISVKVLDVNNNGVEGVDVNFEVTGGGGYLINGNNVPQGALGKVQKKYSTDSQGIASAFWVLGPQPGANSVEASITGLTGSPILFTATGESAVATTMIEAGGNGQTGIRAGDGLPEKLKVKVVDSQGDPVAGIDVLFEEQQGGGVFKNDASSISVVTDPFGFAEARFTLGPTVGVNVVHAINASLAGSPIPFTFISVLGPPAILSINSGDGSSGPVQSLVPISIKTTDVNGNPVPGVSAAFQVIEGGGSVESFDNLTDSQGIATAQIRLPNTTGTLQVKATSDRLPGFFKIFTITVTPGSATNIVMVSENNVEGTVGRELVKPLVVKVLDIFGNPVDGRSIQWVVTNGGGSLEFLSTATDSNGLSENHFTLGSNAGINEAWAIASGLSGSPVVFTATGVTNNFPIFVGLNDTVATEGTLLNIQLKATDADNDPISYAAPSIPPGAVFNSTTALFSWNPAEGQAGDHQVTFKATDNNGGFDEKTITISVRNSNHVPVITDFSPSELSFVFRHGESINFSVTATDGDNDQLTYEWRIFTENDNAGTLLSTSSSFELVANNFLTGTYRVRVEVSDGMDMATLEWESVDIVSSVELATFTARFTGFDGVNIVWTTSREIDNTGFNVLRSLTPNGRFKKINDDLIPTSSDGKYQFTDKKIVAGERYFYKLEDVDINGVKTQHDAVSIDVAAPETFELSQNYPNPFNPETKIRFQLPGNDHVTIKIFNVLGREVRTLLNEDRDAGYHIVTWDAKDNLGLPVSSGIYYYQIVSGEFKETKKMLLMK